MSQKKRKYQDNYLDFENYISYSGSLNGSLNFRISRFRWSSNSSVWPVHETFSNSTMKPDPLKQHLANAHPSMISKNRPFLELKLSRLKRQKLDRTGIFSQTNNAAVHASFAIVLHVAKAKKAHTIGEDLAYWKV